MEKLNSNNFHEEIKSDSVLVDFYADWCGPCRMLHPILEEISLERSNTTIKQINVDESSDIAKEYGVMSIPTLILFKNGLEVSRNVGAISKEDLISWIESN
jgi:thioredoxin 1